MSAEMPLTYRPVREMLTDSRRTQLYVAVEIYVDFEGPIHYDVDDWLWSRLPVSRQRAGTAYGSSTP